MFKYNLLFILRNFNRNRGSVFINLVGLSVGLASALIIFLWVNDELSIDRFFKNDTQLFQVLQNTKTGNGTETIEATPGRLAKALSEEIPEIEYAAEVVPTSFNISKGTISQNDEHIKSVCQYVTDDFFNVFSYQILYGDKDKILSAKNNVVLSRELALKLFGDLKNAVGKTVEWNAHDISGTYTVSGIYDLPVSHSTNQFDLLLNYELFEQVNPWNGWGSSSPHTFVLLKKDASPKLFNEKIKSFLKSKEANLEVTLFAQRFSDRYLNGHYENGKPAGGKIEYVELFSLIAFFILIIACINFMNLSTARASVRMKEVGIKKTVGAGRKALIFQYLGESLIMTFLSSVFALLLVYFLITPFNNLAGKHLVFPFDARFLLIVAAITVFTGLLAGSYPALFLSRFPPIAILKGKFVNSSGEIRVRKGLVIFQFVASVLLILSVWVVYAQLSFVQSKNLGYNKDHVVYFDVKEMSPSALSEIKNIPGVINAAGGNLTAGMNLGGTSDINWAGKNPDNHTFFSVKWVGYNLIETLGMKMAAGNAFSEDYGSPNQVIFNETAIKTMGLTDPIGQSVTANGEKMQIVGIINDFNFESLYEKVKPCVLFVAPMQYAPKLSVKIMAGTEKTTLENLKKVYQKYYPGQPFEYRFMDDDSQKLYVSERRVSTLSKYFAGLAILISCLGLFGLTTFTVERRIKEIGIRKVMGSGISEIVRLLTRDFTRLVIIAIGIALPAGYLIDHSWLESFAYRIDLKWWYFAGTGLITLLIAWLTMGLQTIRAAMVNPVECLKEE